MTRQQFGGRAFDVGKGKYWPNCFNETFAMKKRLLNQSCATNWEQARTWHIFELLRKQIGRGCSPGTSSSLHDG